MFKNVYQAFDDSRLYFSDPELFNAATAELAEAEKLREPIEINEKRHGVAIMVQHEREDRFLVCKRIGCRDMNGLLQFPGGSIEPGETAEEAAFRELWEETGSSVFKTCKPKLLSTVVFWNQGNTFVTSMFHVRLSFRLTAFNMEPDKHGDWQWLTSAEIISQPHISIVKLYLEKYGIQADKSV